MSECQATTDPRLRMSRELLSTEELKQAWLSSDSITFGDPLLAHVAFDYEETYFPLGFPVRITTNSQEVLALADQQWRRFTQLFERPPVQLQIGVTDCDSEQCPPTPICRMQGHVLTNIADCGNYAATDLNRGSSVIWVTQTALKHSDYFRYFFLESSAMCNISGRFATGIHAACVALDGHGLLLCGDSGAGKSTLAYACAQAGWTYVTDDGSYLIHGRTDRLVVGNHRQIRFRPSAESLFPELRGLKVMDRAGVSKPSVEIFVHPNTILNTASTAQIRHIIFLKRNVATQELTAFPRAVARLYMQQRVHCLPYDPEPQMAAIDRLLEIEPSELRYNDLDWAIERLKLLVRKGCP